LTFNASFQAIDEEAMEMSSSSATNSTSSTPAIAAAATAAASSGSSSSSHYHQPHPSPASTNGLNSPAYLSRDVVVELVEHCKKVLHISRKTCNARKREGEEVQRKPSTASSAHCASPHALVAQLLAEWGKSELGRGVCLEMEVVADLEKVLEQQVEAETGEIETTVQVS
jgi:hypothetical protein